jgi:hypothetical protein
MSRGAIKIRCYFEKIGRGLRPGGCAGFNGVGAIQEADHFFYLAMDEQIFQEINKFSAALPEPGAFGVHPRDRLAASDGAWT